VTKRTERRRSAEFLTPPQGTWPNGADSSISAVSKATVSLLRILGPFVACRTRLRPAPSLLGEEGLPGDRRRDRRTLPNTIPVSWAGLLVPVVYSLNNPERSEHQDLPRLDNEDVMFDPKEE
jgi:hypothetical protein